MPTYDFICQLCKKPFSQFISFSEYGKAAISCPACGSAKIQRRIGRIRIARSGSSSLEDLSDDPAALDRMEEDPRAMAHMLKGMRSEMGEETPPEMDEIVDRLDKGQSVDEIEASMPDMGETGSDDISDE